MIVLVDCDQDGSYLRQFKSHGVGLGDALIPVAGVAGGCGSPPSSCHQRLDIPTPCGEQGVSCISRNPSYGVCGRACPNRELGPEGAFGEVCAIILVRDHS